MKVIEVTTVWRHKSWEATGRKVSVAASRLKQCIACLRATGSKIACRVARARNRRAWPSQVAAVRLQGELDIRSGIEYLAARFGMEGLRKIDHELILPGCDVYRRP
jgi:hypothetical protein